MVQLEEGFNWKKPIMDEVYHMDTRIRAVSENCVASSNDLQQVHAKLTLQYYVVGAKAPVLYQKVGTRAAMKEGVLRPAMQESAKATTAKWTAENLITQRHLVKAGIIENINIFINHTLKAKDIDSGIVVANVAITDFSFSEEFNQAIEMKVKAEQEALQAENEKNTTITRAEAAAETVKINSDATAFHIKTIADAKASAITMESTALKKPERASGATYGGKMEWKIAHLQWCQRWNFAQCGQFHLGDCAIAGSPAIRDMRTVHGGCWILCFLAGVMDSVCMTCLEFLSKSAASVFNKI